MNFNDFLDNRAKLTNMVYEVVAENLNKLIERTGYSLIQHNGQRVYQAPGPMPYSTKGCEIFVGKIPRDMFEDELVPIFERVGKIFKLRLMLDFSGTNRGYGFVTYYEYEHANIAVTILHGYEVRPGRHIGVYKSIDNCRLFVGGIPQEKTKEEVYAGLDQYVDGIKDIIMYQAHNDKRLNRGFVFVEFEDHRSAAMARRKLSPGSLILWEVPILVDWADPLPEVDPEVMSKVTKLYLRNLAPDFTNDNVFDMVSEYVSPEYIVKVHKIQDYAFVHFISRKAAEEAKEYLEGARIKGSRVEVSWARPRIYSKTQRLITPPQHYCTSLPPRIRKHIQHTRGRDFSEGTSRSESPKFSPSPLNLPSSSPMPSSTSMFTHASRGRNGHNDCPRMEMARRCSSTSTTGFFRVNNRPVYNLSPIAFKFENLY